MKKSLAIFRPKATSGDCAPNQVRGSRREVRIGAAAVEFAVVAPLFILLVFGLIEFGRMVMVQQIITNASREGARLTALEGTTAASVVSEIGDFLTDSAVNSATVNVSPSSLDGAAYGDPVSVTVDVGFDQVTWLPTPMFLSGTNLSATTVMRREAVN